MGVVVRESFALGIDDFQVKMRSMQIVRHRPPDSLSPHLLGPVGSVTSGPPLTGLSHTSIAT